MDPPSFGHATNVAIAPAALGPRATADLPPAGSISPAPSIPFDARLISIIIAGVLLALSWIAMLAGYRGVAEPLAWISLAIGMVFGVQAAWEALREKQFDIDVLMAIAAALAAWVGHPDDGALLLFLFVLAGSLEERAMMRTKRAVQALGQLMPVTALVYRPTEDSSADPWTAVSPDTIIPGDRIKIRTGDRIPVDGRVRSGATTLDQSSLTGESVPRAVSPGDEVYAGTINVDDPIEIDAAKPASESSIHRILRLVTLAQEQREPIQRFIDRVSQPYAIGVLAASLATLLIWALVLGRDWIGPAPGNAVSAAIALLIVMSPCALVIATPTATLAAISRAAREGVLFKGGQATERLARLSALCVDKTGTLTRGRPSVVDVLPATDAPGDALLAIAAALESGSTHPIAAAITQAASQQRLAIPSAREVNFVAGKGLRASVNSEQAALGTLDLIEPLLAPRIKEQLAALLAQAREQDRIAVVIAHGSRAGIITLADPIRASAATAIQELHALGVKPIVMLTGDHPDTARRIAAQSGVDAWHASLLPEDKVQKLREIVTAVRHDKPDAAVGVMGDGVNDAPSLALADVSIAIGSIGSDAAMESADTVLLSENLQAVPWALKLARQTRSTIRTNITFALLVIGVMAVVTLVASLLRRDIPLPVAVVTHEGGTLLVVLNSLLLTRFKPLAAEQAASAG